MAFVTVAKPLLPILAILLLFSTTIDAQGLVVGYYNSTCPNAETIIRTEVISILTKARSLAGPLLRMFFHDCFVNVCNFYSLRIIYNYSCFVYFEFFSITLSKIECIQLVFRVVMDQSC